MSCQSPPSARSVASPGSIASPQRPAPLPRSVASLYRRPNASALPPPPCRLTIHLVLSPRFASLRRHAAPHRAPADASPNCLAPSPCRLRSVASALSLRRLAQLPRFLASPNPSASSPRLAMPRRPAPPRSATSPQRLGQSASLLHSVAHRLSASTLLPPSSASPARLDPTPRSATHLLSPICLASLHPQRSPGASQRGCSAGR